jgi:hypothetical protein
MADPERALLSWVVACGAAGGALNALLSHNVFLLPSRLALSTRVRVVRLGLLANLAIGAAAAIGAYYAFAGLGPARAEVTVGDLALAFFASLLVGAIAARAATDQTDKRLLRAAVSKACAAPAAHPDTVRAIDVISPYAVFVAASELAPREYPFSRGSS